MSALRMGTAAPPIGGVDFAAGPTGLWFYKVTCPVCQMAAPVAHALEEAYPERFTGIGQDPPEKLDVFDRDHGLGFESVTDLPPYPISNAYGIRVVPTMFLVATDGTILESVESWDRDGYGRFSRTLAELLGAQPARLSVAADLPRFRPG